MMSRELIEPLLAAVLISVFLTLIVSFVIVRVEGRRENSIV